MLFLNMFSAQNVAKRRRRRNPKHNNNEDPLNPNRGKPLTNQQKQDLFLRYNPEFQRLPRFVPQQYITQKK